MAEETAPSPADKEVEEIYWLAVILILVVTISDFGMADTRWRVWIIVTAIASIGLIIGFRKATDRRHQIVLGILNLALVLTPCILTLLYPAAREPAFLIAIVLPSGVSVIRHNRAGAKSQ